MPSTYSSNLRIELIGAGEQAGTWNITTNRNLGSVIEQAITGITSIDITAGDRELTTYNAAVDEARSATVRFVGLPPADVNIGIPNLPKVYTFCNDTDKAVNLYTTDSGTAAKTLPPLSLSYITVDPSKDEFVGFTISYSMLSAFEQSDYYDMLDEMGAAPLDSPNFTGTPTAPTPARGDVSNNIATTAFVRDNSVPIGAILMWSGAVNSIPNGWELCDGNNGTPNLTDRFIIGAGNDFNVGANGGSRDTVVVDHNHGGFTGNQNRSHTHSGNTASAGAHSHNMGISFRPYYTSGGSAAGTAYNTGSTSTDGAHTHSFTTGAQSTSHQHSIANDGVSGKDKNMPPYYALCFIMRV